MLQCDVEGRTVRAATEDVVGSPELGDRFLVRYDPVEPELYVRDATVPDTPAWFIALTFALAVPFLLMAVQGWRRRLPRWVLGADPWAGERPA